jgi:hypothetical protein
MNLPAFSVDFLSLYLPERKIPTIWQKSGLRFVDFKIKTYLCSR